MFVCLPPAEDQKIIVDWVTDQTASFASLTAAAQREIELLREYRTRLIADILTGKLDVREAAAELPDEVEEIEPIEDPDVPMDGDEGIERAELETSAEDTIS
jgi:type I restriction enzyme S subunit